MTVSDLPALNATLNGICTVFLILGWWFIRRGEQQKHIAMMIASLVVSVVFLVFYCIYHYHAGVGTRFGNQGPIVTPVYFFILITHIILAAAIAIMVPLTVVPALRRRFNFHRRIGRWTMPIWIYVSITGVLVYLMLYRWYPPSALSGS